MNFDEGKYITDVLTIIDSETKLTTKQLEELLEYEIAIETGEDRRWSRSNISLLKLGDRHFVLEWEQGLTERQDNEFYSQPVEVGNPTEREIVLRKRDWYDAAGKIVFTQDA